MRGLGAVSRVECGVERHEEGLHLFHLQRLHRHQHLHLLRLQSGLHRSVLVWPVFVSVPSENLYLVLILSGYQHHLHHRHLRQCVLLFHLL